MGLWRLMFNRSFGHIGTTKAAMNVDYELTLWGGVNNYNILYEF